MGACLAVRRRDSALQAFICYGFAAALTIATMPARIASGNRSHAAMTAARSWSFDAAPVPAPSAWEPVSVKPSVIWSLRRQIPGFEDRIEHQQRKRSPKCRQEAQGDCTRRNPSNSRGSRSSISEQPILLSRQEAMDIGPRPLSSSAVFSGYVGFATANFKPTPRASV